MRHPYTKKSHYFTLKKLHQKRDAKSLYITLNTCKLQKSLGRSDKYLWCKGSRMYLWKYKRMASWIEWENKIKILIIALKCLYKISANFKMVT